MPRFKSLPGPDETVFLTQRDVDEFHEFILKPEQVRGYKSLDGLLGAIGRPQLALQYETGCDLVRVAAYYWHAFSTSHAYIDGNKRTGFVCAVNFLLMNGIRFAAPDVPLGPWIESLFLEGRFEVNVLDDTLRRHCHWAT